MALGPELAAREYNSLREELLGWNKHRAMMSFTIATLSAGLFVLAGQQKKPYVSASAMLLPQVLVAWAYAYLRRSTKLLTRLACYLVVFHELPKGGGWELFHRYPFKNTLMRPNEPGFLERFHTYYTTHGMLLVILLSSALVLILAKPFVPWGLIGMLLPIAIVTHHLIRVRRSGGYEAECLEEWHRLKGELDNREVEAVFSDVVDGLRKKVH